MKSVPSAILRRSLSKDGKSRSLVSDCDQDTLCEAKQYLSAKSIRNAAERTFYEKQLQIETLVSYGSGFILGALYLLHLLGFTTASMFFDMHYQVSGTEYVYNKGLKDFYYFSFLFLSLLFFRSTFALRFGRNLAVSLGIKRFKTINRFTEQFYGMVMAAVSFVFGIYLYLKFPQFLRLDTAWTSYPIIEMPQLIKFYYLYQAAFWSTALFYIFIEQRRSDFLAMLVHHIVTISLIAGSYLFNYSAIGIIIHVTMDFVDIFLPLAKLFKYLNYTTATNVAFAFMAISWVVTRHIIFLRIIINIAFESLGYIQFNYDPLNGVYATPNIQNVFTLFLVILQILCYVWLYSIVLIIIDAVNGKVLDDVRSEEE
ncbi:Sphingosine N-acyltransferase lag1 [Smittium mucronatum]|uniref:Sphingosine N-acyltransferase lag1 n=1 Tax=Smittium mucronatum TaxID=133383 RepID=A0A1R0H4Y3_9FUNG|nr:Sphingosine N-acyltransferase lag1 [Smittium mucronatum]